MDVAAGVWKDAERLWWRVLEREPGNPLALYSLGVHAFREGALERSLDFLSRALRSAPMDPMIPLAISVIHRETGALDDEWASIGEALARDPYSLHGLLCKAEFLERNGRVNQATAVYRDTLKVAPTPWPEPLSARLGHALARVDAERGLLSHHLGQRLAGLRDRLPPEKARRWDEAVSIASGRTAPYPSQCNQLYVPRLPAIPFFDPCHFPWIEALQQRTAVIRAELEALIATSPELFTPYVAYRPGEPVNQWGELNHSRAWSSFHLWQHGKPLEHNIARCPETARAMQAVDSASIGGLCPNVMFSALAPRTAIPPHHGETNARLVAHLPLVVPDGCSFRVGSEWRNWEEGKVLVFDDTIEHEARNDGDALRVVVIFDVWNPLLSQEEREAVNLMSDALHDFRAEKTG